MNPRDVTVVPRNDTRDSFFKELFHTFGTLQFIMYVYEKANHELGFSDSNAVFILFLFKKTFV